MIKNIEIDARHVDVTEDLKAYINKKVGKLERYVPKKERNGLHAEVKLKEEDSKKNDKYTCEIIVHLPSGKITAKDSTMNIFAAVDIVEAKLRNQLQKHKAKQSNHKSDRKGLLSRIRKSADKDYWGKQN